MEKKWNLQDIRPATQKRPPVSSNQPPLRPTLESDIPTRQQSTRNAPSPVQNSGSEFDTIDIINGNASKRKHAIITAIIALCIIGVAYYANVLLGGAVITVQPKTKEITVQSEISAKKTPLVGELSYELLSLDASAEKQVKANGKEQAKVPASGTIFVYNKNTTSQKLIANTRFESPDGLIYRIKDGIEVPPTSKTGDEIIPGKIVTNVFADTTGEKYNIQPTQFTIPGLKGSPQYDLVYAESTTAFTGGFEGERYIIDQADLQTSQQELHIELRNTLLAQLKEKVPAGFVVYDDSVALTYESLPATEYAESLATIKEKATLRVPMFKEDSLATFIATLSVPDYKNEPIKLKNPHDLTFSYTDAEMSSRDISTFDSLEFTLKGSTKLIWKFDEEQLKADLLGKKKTDSTQILSTYKSIVNTNAVVRPFWVSSFPEKKDDITIHTEEN